MSSWVGELVANGAGAAIGASLGGYLAFAIGRKQIRQTKLEQCITLLRDIANRNREALWDASRLLRQGHKNDALGLLSERGVHDMVEWVEDLYTLIEVHAPKQLNQADKLLVSTRNASSVFTHLSKRHGPGNPQDNAEMGVYLTEIRVTTSKLCTDLKGALLVQASTVSQFSLRRWLCRYARYSWIKRYMCWRWVRRYASICALSTDNPRRRR